MTAAALGCSAPGFSRSHQLALPLPLQPWSGRQLHPDRPLWGQALPLHRCPQPLGLSSVGSPPVPVPAPSVAADPGGYWVIPSAFPTRQDCVCCRHPPSAETPGCPPRSPWATLTPEVSPGDPRSLLAPQPHLMP